jgi:O-methyltransferase involved in polyketide biosynthesis
MATPEQRRSVRSEGDEWDIASSVGYTALLVAGWRAIHTASPHPLAADRFADLFITASGDPYLTGLLADPPTAEDATVFPHGRTPPEVDVKVDAVLRSEYLIATR